MSEPKTVLNELDIQVMRDEVEAEWVLSQDDAERLLDSHEQLRDQRDKWKAYAQDLERDTGATISGLMID